MKRQSQGFNEMIIEAPPERVWAVLQDTRRRLLAHPLIEDLKRKDFVVVTRFDEVDVCRRDFIDRLAARYQRVTPFVKFLTQAMELAWRKHETLRDERGFVR